MEGTTGGSLKREEKKDTWSKERERKERQEKGSLNQEWVKGSVS